MHTSLIQQISIQACGGPEQLILDTRTEIPQPGPGQILVDVEAAGVNYLDVMQRKGMLPVPMPYVPGFEGVGRIRSVGADVASLREGQRVAWVDVRGSYTSRLVVPAARAIVVPETLTTAQSLLFQALTAQYLVSEYRAVQPGDRVLVHAGASGVGQLLVQWLKHLGAWVVVTTSSQAKAAAAHAAGADAVIDYGQDYVFLEALLSLTDGRGVDLAFDSVGAATLPATIKGLARGGTVVVCGSSSGLPLPINPMELIPSCIRVAGGSVFSYLVDPAELQRRAIAVQEGVDAGWLRMPEGQAFALAQASQAHAALEGRGIQGKLFLVP